MSEPGSNPDPPHEGGDDYHRFAAGCFWAVPISVGLWALILYLLLMFLG